MKRQTAFFIMGSMLSIAVANPTFATNGYWSHGYGPEAKSLAGACVAMTISAMCAATNPGSLAFVSNRLEWGVSLFAPTRGFTADDNAALPGPMGPASIPPGSYESDNDYFLIPHFAYNKQLDASSTIGVALGGNGGMNTEYKGAVFGNFADPRSPLFPNNVPTSPTGIDLIQAFLGITYSKKLNERQAIGIMPILAVQSLAVQGLQPFKPFSRHPNNVTNNGHDMSYGGGIRIGWLGRVNDRLTLGAAYQSQLWMTRFEDYKGLLADEGNFDIPANYDLGFAFDITPTVTFSFNYQHINFSSINAIGNASDLVFMPGQILLGTGDGLGFGWEDMRIYKAGIQWQYTTDWVFRAGFSDASNAFPHTQALFNVLAPAVVTKHYTLGFEKAFKKDNYLAVAFMYAPNKAIHGTNVNTGPQTGHVEMDQWEITLGWRKRF
jgi:long-chain fatty acid transport protein